VHLYTPPSATPHVALPCVTTHHYATPYHASPRLASPRLATPRSTPGPDVDNDAVVNFADFVSFCLKFKVEGVKAILWSLYASDATLELDVWSSSSTDLSESQRFYLQQVFNYYAAIDSKRIRFPADLLSALRIALPTAELQLAGLCEVCDARAR
jgi:hypothetical protein